MAGERKGKTYEALIKVALDHLKAKGAIAGDVYWNVKPNGVSVKPDFTVGKTPDAPDFVFLITHAGASKKSTMKMWRNLGELSEAKVLLPKLPVVYSILFDAVAYDALKELQSFVFDGQLIVGDRAYGQAVQAWVDTNNNRLPTDETDRAKEISGRLSGGKDQSLCAFFPMMVNDLKKMIAGRRPELDGLWRQERARKTGCSPKARVTSVRRGLSKILVFESLDVALKLYRNQRLALSDVPEYAYTLNFASKAIGRAKPSDQEILGAVSLLTDGKIRDVLRRFDVAPIAAWLTTLRNAPHLDFIGQYVLAERENLCDPDELYRRFIKLHDNPLALVDLSKVPPNWPPTNVWLLEYLIELMKVTSGDMNGFGHAQLGRMVLESGNCAPDDLTSAIGFGGGFGLSTWLARKPDSKFKLSLIKGIARVVSPMIQKSSKAELAKSISNLSSSYTRNLIEAKLCAYVGFDPLWLLISAVIPDVKEDSIRACFAEAAKITGGAAKMQVAHAKKTIINWQSATDAGKDHKVKELSGRAVALRYTWDAKKKAFVPRSDLIKLCLVVDGSWTQEDLDILIRAGWDEIFYPDEMDQLAKAIV